MRGFEISEDCMMEKSSKAIAKELMKGSFVIGCDYKNKQLVLENVFHLLFSILFTPKSAILPSNSIRLRYQIK